MLNRIQHFLARAYTLSLDDLRTEDGQTTVEYAVVLALVILLAVGAFQVLSGSITDYMNTVGTQIKGLVPASL
jgi:Flp pilus assembly pilin Flp